MANNKDLIISGSEVLIDDCKCHTRDLEAALSIRDMPEAMPDGVKFIYGTPEVFTVVHQQHPGRRLLKWISPNSPVPYGSGAKYRQVQVALPYMVTVTTYNNGKLVKDQTSLYFSNRSIRNEDDELLFPCLLNVSVHPGPDGVWVCTQHLRISSSCSWVEHLEAFLHHVFGGGFNLSSEHNEGNSWFTKTSREVEDVSTVEKWEQWSKEDPGHCLEVSWLTTGKSVKQIAQEQLAALTPASQRSVHFRLKRHLKKKGLM